MKYFKSHDSDYNTSVFVRHFSEAEAASVFELYTRAYETQAMGPLRQVSWWEGWNAFRGVPTGHEVTWEEFEGGTEFGKYSASRSDLLTRQSSLAEKFRRNLGL